MNNKKVILITLLVIAIVITKIFIIVNVSFMNEIKPYISSGPTWNVVFEITSEDQVAIEGGVNEIG